MRDPYTVLGVSRTSSDDEIKSAYRGLAKKFHPDLNPGKKEIEHKFKEINAAYDILSDPAKRAKFDNGELDSSGNDRGGPGAGASAYRRYRSTAGAGDDFSGFAAEDIFADLFGGMKARGTRFHGNWGESEDPFAAQRRAARGADLQATVHVSFVEAALGAKKRIRLPTNKTIDVTIPPATETGNKLRLKGLGYPGAQEGMEGDALIDIQVTAHPFFTKKGQDIHLELPVTLYEAVQGATVQVPTLEGPVEIKVPKGSNTGNNLRLRSKGIPDPQGVRGDQYVKLKIVLPDTQDEQLTRFVEKWGDAHPYDPRKKVGMV